MCILDLLRSLICKKKKRISIFVDGPNMIRREYNIDLVEITKKLEKEGNIVKKEVYLNQYANDKLIEAVSNQGYKPIILPTDVDVAMSVEATSEIYENNCDIIVFVTRDSDFIPVIEVAKRKNKKVYVVVDEPYASALKNFSDKIIIINNKKK